VEHALSNCAFDDAIELSRRTTRLIGPAGAPALVAAKCDVLTGRALLLAGRIPEARTFLEAAIARSDPTKVPAEFGELHVWLARACNQLGVVEQARRAVDEALEQLPMGAPPLAKARLLIARGQLNEKENPESAVEDAKLAVKLMPKPRPASDELAAFGVLTIAARMMGEPEKSIRYAEHREKRARSMFDGQVLERISALRDLALALSMTGDRIKAREHLNEAYNLARESGYRVEEAILVRTLGEQLYISGSFREAITRFQQAATLSAELGQHADRAESLKALGASYMARGDYDRAVDHLRSAVEAFDRAGRIADVVSARSVLANAQLAKSLLADAQTTILEAARRLPEEGLNTVRAELLCAEGNLAAAQGDFDRAKEKYLRAMATARAANELFILGEALTGYAQLLLRYDHPSRAYRMVKRAEWIFSDLDARGQLKRISPLVNATEGLSRR